MAQIDKIINYAEIFNVDDDTNKEIIGEIAHEATIFLNDYIRQLRHERLQQSNFEALDMWVNALYEVMRDIAHQKVVDVPTIQVLNIIKERLNYYYKQSISFKPYSYDYMAFGLPQFIEHNTNRAIDYINTILALS